MYSFRYLLCFVFTYLTNTATCTSNTGETTQTIITAKKNDDVLLDISAQLLNTTTGVHWVKKTLSGYISYKNCTFTEDPVLVTDTNETNETNESLGCVVFLSAHTWRSNDIYVATLYHSLNETYMKIVFTLIEQPSDVVYHDCAPTTISATLGTSITLAVPYNLTESNVPIYIEWYGRRHGFFATTISNGTIQYVDSLFENHINVSANGSLIISNLCKDIVDVYTSHIYLSTGVIIGLKYELYIPNNLPDPVYIYSHISDSITLRFSSEIVDNSTKVAWYKNTDDDFELISVCYFDTKNYLMTWLYNDSIETTNCFLHLLAYKWIDGDTYYANITSKDNESFPIIFIVKELRTKFIPYKETPIFVQAKEGYSATFPINYDIPPEDIDTIDWLTEKYYYFAQTTPNGTITFIRAHCFGKISASSNGSLIIDKVSMNHDGLYRAIIYLKNNFMLERKFTLSVITDPSTWHTNGIRRPWEIHLLITLAVTTFITFSLLLWVLFVVYKKYSDSRANLINNTKWYSYSYPVCKSELDIIIAMSSSNATYTDTEKSYTQEE